MTEAEHIAEVPALVRDLYSIVRRLEEMFEGRRFTLDGHLVGSIGEVVAAHRYSLKLIPASAEGHDARASSGKLVQVKATQGKMVALRSEPEHLIVLKLLPDGNTEEVFNGPGYHAWNSAGPKQKNGTRSIGVSKLKRLMEDVPQKDRILPRSVS